MPVSTRQATPGPSVSTPTVPKASSHSVNSRKRPGSEILEDMRDAKKMKVEGETLSTISINGKDKKKKKKKKKKRASVVIQSSTQSTHNEVSKAKPEKEVTKKQGSTSTSREPEQHLTSSSVGDEVKPIGNAMSEPSFSDKGKGKAKSHSPPQAIAPLPADSVEPVASGSGSSNVTQETSSQALEIARLKEELASKENLLTQHQNLFNNHQQSLTCQICHDPLYKPYALAPCGHITCYGCLIRWFTAPQNPDAANANEPALGVDDNVEAILDSVAARNGAFIRRRKMCPVCRAVVSDRPIEVWSIKDMVAALVRSGLADLPPPVHKTSVEDANNVDPWRNLFRRAGLGNMHMHPFGAAFNAFLPHAFAAPPLEQGEEDREQMGWHDAEDGGIYRCIDCYHEIWGGVCSGCERRYPGHGLDDDDDDDEGSDGDHPNILFGRHIAYPYHFDDDEEDSDGEEEEDPLFPNWLEGHPDAEDDSGSEGDPPMDFFEYFGMGRHHGRHPVDQADSEEEEDSEDDEYGPEGPQDLFIPPHAFARIQEVGDEEVDDEDEDEDSYEGSFIDDDVVEGPLDGMDDDDEVEIVEAPGVRRARRRAIDLDDETDGEGPDVIDFDVDEEEDEDEAPAAALLRHYLAGRFGRQQHNVEEVDLDSDEEDGDLGVNDDDEEEEDGVLPGYGNVRMARRGRRIHLMSDEDDE